jgi:hypothetical protein
VVLAAADGEIFFYVRVVVFEFSQKGFVREIKRM